MFTDIEWGTVSELTASLLEFAITKKVSPDTSQDTFLETERRWLAKDGPGLIRRVQYEHNHPSEARWSRYEYKRYIEAWLCGTPGSSGEIRVHRTFNPAHQVIGNYICYKTGFKDPSGLTRDKYEFMTPEMNFNRIMTLISKDPTITPFVGSIVVPVDLWILTYQISDDISVEYEIRSADNGNRVWIDVEFPTEEAAKNFALREQYQRFIDREITNDPSETMASYWYRTRVHPYMGT